jgi:hypothetical protein
MKPEFKNASESFKKRNSHLFVDHRIQDTEQRERTEALARDNEGKTSSAGLRHCRFTLYRKKLLDVDAKYASVKDLLDCLAIAGIIRGDKEGEITLEVLQQKRAQCEAEKTIIEVFETGQTNDHRP